jgi:hypothetical protein
MPRPPKISKSSTIPKASASAPFSVLYWQTPCVCGFQAKSAAEWQHHGIVYQGCGKQRKANSEVSHGGAKS